MLCLLAKIPPVTVVPLFPPNPTNIIPNLGTYLFVSNSYFVDYGVTIY